jgi:hypothetical protein
MAKVKIELTPERVAAYEAAMARIVGVTGATTQVRLADVLEVRQSSISDAKRRASIPPEWLLKLMRSHQVMPDWALTGQGPKFIGEAAPAAVARVESRLNDMTVVLQDTVDAITDALRMARMTADEFALAKSASMTELAKSRETIKNLQGQLRDMSAEVSACHFAM